MMGVGQQVAIGVAALLAALPARAEPGAAARLAYARSAQASSCPDQTALRAAVARRLGYDPFLAAARQTIIVDVAAEPHGLVGRVRLVDADGLVQGTRDLRSSTGDCEELVASLALAISITLDPAAAFEGAEAASADPSNANTKADPALDEQPGVAASPTPASVAARASPTQSQPPLPLRDVAKDRRTPVRPPRPAQSGLGFALRTGALGAVGIAPAPNTGFWAGLGVGRALVRGNLEFRADLPASKAAPPEGRVESALVAGSLSGCLAPGLLAFCAVSSAGVRAARGVEVSSPRDDRAFFFGVGAGVEARVGLGPRLALLINAEALGVLTPLTLRLRGGDVWDSPMVASAVRVGVQFDL